MALQGVVNPHRASVVAWDVPPAIEAGKRFRMKVGIKCSPGSPGSDFCRLSDMNFSVINHEEEQVATGTLPDDRWPGTTGLYAAEVELQAPAAAGLYTWSVEGPQSNGSDAGTLHAEGSIRFGLRVVGRPEYRVRVETVDKTSQAPLRGAHVVMPPYRAVTDERGVAEVRVAKGAYRLFVSQTRYLTFALPVEVTADMTTRAELDLEPLRERN